MSLCNWFNKDADWSIAGEGEVTLGRTCRQKEFEEEGSEEEEKEGSQEL